LVVAVVVVVAVVAIAVVDAALVVGKPKLCSHDPPPHSQQDSDASSA
jgi:hypothetical protein